MDKKKLSARQKAAKAGVSHAHYCAVIAHTGKPSYEVALRIAKIESVHFRHLLDPENYDETGRKIRHPKVVATE
jgi:hypothetical protein